MNKLLNIMLKGLLTSFVMIITGGILFLNIKTSPSTSMVLVSSSVVNSLKIDTNLKNEKKKEEVKVEEVKLEEEVVELKEEKIEDKKEEIKEEKKEEVKTTVPEPAQPSVPGAIGTYAPNMDAVNVANVVETYSGKMTAYGPDCDGCYSGETASGVYVGNGNIYYNHPIYGNIRIVAGDYNLMKNRSVVRINFIESNKEPIIAVVLDTGEDIGRGKPKGIVLDLLFPSEYTPEARHFGQQKVTVEVLN